MSLDEFRQTLRVVLPEDFDEVEVPPSVSFSLDIDLSAEMLPSKYGEIFPLGEPDYLLSEFPSFEEKKVSYGELCEHLAGFAIYLCLTIGSMIGSKWCQSKLEIN